MSVEKIKKATELLDKAMQMNDKQYDKFCKRLHNEFKDASTEEYTTILHIICSLDALRSKKGA